MISAKSKLSISKIISVNSGQQVEHCPSKKKKWKNQDELIKDILQLKIMSGPCNKLFCKTLFREVRFPTGAYEDTTFLIHLLLKHKVENIVAVQTSYYHVFNPQSTTRTFDEKKMMDFQANQIDRIKHHLQEFNQYKVFKKYYLQWILLISNACIFSLVTLYPKRSTEITRLFKKHIKIDQKSLTFASLLSIALTLDFNLSQFKIILKLIIVWTNLTNVYTGKLNK